MIIVHAKITFDAMLIRHAIRRLRYHARFCRVKDMALSYAVAAMIR